MKAGIVLVVSAPTALTDLYLNPFFYYDWKYIGIGTGLHLNVLRSKYDDFVNFPGSLYFRAGRLDRFYFDCSAMQNYYMDGVYGRCEIDVGLVCK